MGWAQEIQNVPNRPLSFEPMLADSYESPGAELRAVEENIFKAAERLMRNEK